MPGQMYESAFKKNGGSGSPGNGAMPIKALAHAAAQNFLLVDGGYPSSAVGLGSQ